MESPPDPAPPAAHPAPAHAAHDRSAPEHPGLGAARMGVLYALIFGGAGVSLPFIAPWFTAHGLTGAEVGVVLGAPMLARLVTSPLIAVWADSFALRRTALAVLAATAAAAYLLLGLSRSLALWLPLWFVAATAMSHMIPLTDVLTLRRARTEGFAFGVPRGVGSLAFVIANVTMGLLIGFASIDLVPIWITICATLSFAAAWGVLPREPVHQDGPRSRAERFSGLGRLVADPVFMTAIAAVGAVQATHAFFYAFSALSWKAQGLSDTTIGLLWAAGVVAEIVFLWFLEPWRRRMGPWKLVVFGALGAAVRWSAMAFSPPLWILFPLQILHALSFAASFVGGLQMVERLSPRDSVSAAQTLSSALSSGVLIGLATMLSGPLYDHYGAKGYLAMAVVALAGLAAVWRLRGRLEG